MKTKYIKYSLMSLLFMVTALLMMTVPAQAHFVIDTNPGGEKSYLIQAVDTNSFSGSVGENSITPDVDVTTIGKVDTANGYATIKPVKNGVLTDLLFTPTGNNKYGDFSFRGQLEDAGFTGIVDVKVTDQIDTVFIFEFTIEKANQDFDRIGVVSTDGEWIKSVEIWTTGTGGFKEVKQIDFSSPTSAPVPIPAAFWLFGTGIFGIVGIRRRFQK